MNDKTKTKGKMSLGERNNVSRKITNAARREYLGSPERIMNQLSAFRAGKRVVVTIANPNKEERNKPFIKVLASSVWKDPRNASA